MISSSTVARRLEQWTDSPDPEVAGSNPASCHESAICEEAAG